MSQPQVKVGIMSSPAIRFVFPTAYSFGGQTVEGAQEATLSDGKVLWGGALYDSVEFTPCDAENGSFELIDVTIGVNFHWERKENQSFRGSLRIIVEGDKLTAVNILPIEEYLLSVISSEMSATASLELLKAHAVISRSWLLAQIEKNKQLAAEETPYNPCTRTEGELVRWYDREDHVNFDVCADDHCQRYQGITRESTATVRDAIKATWGQVLTYDGTTYQATIVGVDEDNDIALLKVDASGVTPVTFGDSDSMTVGDTVYAVGNPLGELEFTMTSGMISALDRTITTSDGTDNGINMFQIDAAVNAGNSGGPVYNTSGQVIGIVTAKYSSSGVEGLGFAIPVNDAVAIANDLMKNGTVTDRAQLGITLQTIPDSAAQYYNMPLSLIHI